MISRRIAIVTTLLGLLLLAYVLGLQSGFKQDQAFQFFRDIKQAFIPPPSRPERLYQLNDWEQLVDYKGKTIVPRPAITPETMVIFAFGQSNSANHGGERFIKTSDKVLNFWGDQFYLAADPLLGATGFAGSMWTQMGHLLVDAQVASQVILLTAGVGLTQVRDWQPGGKLHTMLRQRLQQAKANGLTVTHFLWHQGESDDRTPPSEYTVGLRQVIETTQHHFPQSKFLVAQTSRCFERDTRTELLNAQQAAATAPGVYLGPNTDLISREDRYDDCHFSGRGLEKAAHAWVQAIIQAEKKKAQTN